MIFLTGGARSGKSTLAVEAFRGRELQVAYIATGVPADEEMKERIRAHQRHRPRAWELIEEPADLVGALARVGEGPAVIIDCLTLWVSNLMARHDDEEIHALSDAASLLAASRGADTVVVSNEVGSGLVPMDPVGRRFRDLQGVVNQIWARRSKTSFLVVAGAAVPLSFPGSILD